MVQAIGSFEVLQGNPRVDYGIARCYTPTLLCVFLLHWLSNSTLYQLVPKYVQKLNVGGALEAQESGLFKNNETTILYYLKPFGAVEHCQTSLVFIRDHKHDS